MTKNVLDLLGFLSVRTTFFIFMEHATNRQKELRWEDDLHQELQKSTCRQQKRQL